MANDTTPSPVDLLGTVPDELAGALAAHFLARGEPAYRVQQVLHWIYQSDAVDVDGMTNLPERERKALSEAFSLSEPEAQTVSISSDGTVKHLWKLVDGELIESVLIPTDDRLTLCLSSQAGCAMGCTFCATGWAGFRRQLSAGEIVAQYRGAGRWARTHEMGPISNIVYMGMGEPLANRKAVHASLTILNQGYSVGARRITVSTVGLVPGILELAERPEQFRLALSLHSPESALRQELIPLEKRFPLPAVVRALQKFNEAGGKRITFEYTMIRGVNDDLMLAPKLADLAMSLHAFVNLIPFNPIPFQDWGPSTRERIAAFRETLEARGVAVAVRQPRGRDIDAACGQLRATAMKDVDVSSESG